MKVLTFLSPLALKTFPDSLPDDRFSFFVSLGRAVADAIVSEMNSMGIDLHKCRGQAYDGASNMSGAINGCAALIREQFPLATYQHCKSHCLNLAIMKTATVIPEIGTCIS